MTNVTLNKVYGSLPLEVSTYSALIQNVSQYVALELYLKYMFNDPNH